MSQADRDRAFELAGKWFVDHADKIRGRQQAAARPHRDDGAARPRRRARS